LTAFEVSSNGAFSKEENAMRDKDLHPFRLAVPEAVLEDLRQRLARTRFPDEPPLDPWSTGTSVSYLKELIDYWLHGFDWRAREAKLKAFRQFTVPMAGIDLHFILEQGNGPNPMPLLLSHGWPGSVIEFHKVLPMLTDITLYWITGAIGSSFWPYYGRMHGPWPIPEGSTVDVPTGYVEFPKEILRPPRSVGERMYTNIRRWTVMSKGGHFAALEQPGVLVEEIRAFFRTLR